MAIAGRRGSFGARGLGAPGLPEGEDVVTYFGGSVDCPRFAVSDRAMASAERGAK